MLYWFVFHRSITQQNILLLIASYFFYGWWSWEFAGLLVLSTFLDYQYGFLVASSNRNRAKTFLWLSIVNNLGILCVFKYYNFFATQFQNGFKLLGLDVNPVLLDIALPIGISFYTFHGMSYVFDIYRGKQAPSTTFVDYAVFVAFFPLLVAGPIERANHLLPQVQTQRTFDYRQAVDGCKLILWGLFKKVVIADGLAKVVDPVFDHYGNYDGITLIVAAVAFSFQIYGDFSGYSDIALGTAKLFGFELLSNFRFPYFSRDVGEFWRRWHISLSSWFRDYLYIPLGGSKQGKGKAVRNTFIIFLVSGFWHGASWNFIIWGFIHACGFLPLLLLSRNRQHTTEVVAYHSAFPSLKEFFQMLATFSFVSLAWVFFRTKGIDHAFGYFSRIFDSLLKPMDAIRNFDAPLTAFLYIVCLIFTDWYLRRNERQLRVPENRGVRFIFYWAILLVVFVRMTSNRSESFIYFQF